MTETVRIPKLANCRDPGPGWVSVVDPDGKPLKPHIKCKCGTFTGIGLHDVHADGRVTASFYDINGPWEHKGRKYVGHGCGWHVHLVLANYNLGDFPPRDD